MEAEAGITTVAEEVRKLLILFRLLFVDILQDTTVVEDTTPEAVSHTEVVVEATTISRVGTAAAAAAVGK